MNDETVYNDFVETLIKIKNKINDLQYLPAGSDNYQKRKEQIIDALDNNERLMMARDWDVRYRKKLRSFYINYIVLYIIVHRIVLRDTMNEKAVKHIKNLYQIRTETILRHVNLKTML